MTTQENRVEIQTSATEPDRQPHRLVFCPEVFSHHLRIVVCFHYLRGEVQRVFKNVI